MKTKEDKLNLLKQAKKKEDEFKLLRKTKKNFIKQEPNRWKRFWKLCWFYFSYPWIWVWKNIRDWRTFLIFFLTMAVVGCEVWIPLLLGVIFKGTTFGTTMLSVGGACLFFWNCVPFTPFLPLCIVITIAVKGLFNKLRFKALKNSK